MQGIIVLDALLKPRPSRGLFEASGFAQRRGGRFEFGRHPLHAGAGELSFRAFISIIVDVAVSIIVDVAAAAERYGGARYSSSSSVEALVPRGSRA